MSQSSPQSSLQSSVQSSPQWSLNQSVSDSADSVDLEVTEAMVSADTEFTVLVLENSEVWEWEESDSDTEVWVDSVDSGDTDTDSIKRFLLSPVEMSGRARRPVLALS